MIEFVVGALVIMQLFLILLIASLHGQVLQLQKHGDEMRKHVAELYKLSGTLANGGSQLAAKVCQLAETLRPGPPPPKAKIVPLRGDTPA